MKSKTLRILMAVLCLMMAIGIATGSTFAWFSMNNKVLVTGMTVTTKVNNNLLIAPVDSSDANDGNNEGDYLISLNQVREGILEPVSTIDGVSFWYTSTSNVEGSGDAKTNVYTEYDEDTAHADASANKTHYDDDFNANYGFSAPTEIAYGYIDYSFYLKGTSAETVTRKIYMDKCNLLYDGSTPTDKAFRVAVFSQSASANTAQTTAISDSDLVAILKFSDAGYFTSNYGISENDAPSTEVTSLNSPVVIGDATVGSSVYYKVTVRLWLEGEDTTCNNDTFASLTSDWTLDLSFTLGDSGTDDANAVSQLGGIAVATFAKSTVSGTATLSVSGEVADTYAFYKADGTAISSGSDNFTIAENVITNSGTERSVYCVITTQKGNTYRTPTITLDDAT
jgi:hypothetical protein